MGDTGRERGGQAGQISMRAAVGFVAENGPARGSNCHESRCGSRVWSWPCRCSRIEIPGALGCGRPRRGDGCTVAFWAQRQGRFENVRGWRRAWETDVMGRIDRSLMREFRTQDGVLDHGHLISSVPRTRFACQTRDGHGVHVRRSQIVHPPDLWFVALPRGVSRGRLADWQEMGRSGGRWVSVNI